MRVVTPSSKRFSTVLEVPNLIELQLNSYRWFLEEGLPELFKTFSPIYDFTQSNFLELVSFTLGEPKYSLQECRDRDFTYEAPIKAVVRLGGKERDLIESEVYLGDLPLMTDKGTFIINGRERVIVSQLSRSPGLYYEEDVDTAMQVMIKARVIPTEGPWLDVESDANSVVRAQISQTKKLPVTQLIKALYGYYTFDEAGRVKTDGRGAQRRKLVDSIGKRLVEKALNPDTGEVVVDLNVTVTKAIIDGLDDDAKLIEAMSVTPLGTNDEIVAALTETLDLDDPQPEQLEGMTAMTEVANADGEVLVRPGEVINADTALAIANIKGQKLTVRGIPAVVSATIAADTTQNPREALLDIYKRMRPGEPANEEAAKTLVYGLFFDIKRYDLGRVGRRFLNQRLGINVPLNVRNLTAEDLARMLLAMRPYMDGRADRDDIDDLKNKRVKSVGELLASQLRQGFVRMEKVARERMTSPDQDNLLPSIILSVKPISASIKTFFNGNQLSTFMDQTNPLSEITNKRRLSSLGPGGVSRNNAKLEVRDVHRSHYGRICPIETPEGPNIGLISQLTTHARVDEFGFIMTPYRVVKDARVSGDLQYLTAQEENALLVAPADTVVDDDGNILADRVQVRCAGGTYQGASYPTVSKAQINYMDISPVQIISVATALIPFLENDDANRALMGANMQRQAVPCLRSDKAIVGTGYERVAAVDSGAAVIARNPGKVTSVTALEIQVQKADGTLDVYPLQHMVQSNKSTCFTQRPVVDLNQRVLVGDPLADGPCVDNGELALGQNVVVAFMPWHGYNYEDAILISERVVRDDVYTSIHIERHETEAVDTKLGPEEITRDIPNVGEEALKDLDENGIIRIGAEVRPEDILVGKVAPKGQVEMTAEERLIIAIFGKKAEETRDVSLRLPHGEKGTIVDVKVYSRFKYLSPSINYVYKESKKRDRLLCDRTDEPLLQIPGDELPAGTNMTVQVYVAQKRKLMVGDKMAGRHGNKGVISRVLPVEDLPYLADGTPVDIVLNPLGVPSRMNIGQILETHLGYVGRHLGLEYKCPAFAGATEAEVIVEMSRLSDHMRSQVLAAYARVELGIDVSFRPDDEFAARLALLDTALRTKGHNGLERISRIIATDSLRSVEELKDIDLHSFEVETTEDEAGEAPFAADDAVYAAIVAKIRDNVIARSGLDPKTMKSTIRDGLTGEILPNPITVGMIYMLKLEHLVDEKIHARSIGPYSLVTQQPLGGKAQFGGQRFGEMEVWALEAYGAAYTLQELLTIKSDDVNGRVKAYESIVKGEAISDPGVPESFKILVNELRSLGLKVSVEDAQMKELPLKDLNELSGPEDGRLARSVSFYGN